MNLNDLLKVDTVRCVKTRVQEDLVEGRTYKLEGFDDEIIKIVDHRAFSSWHNKNLFEPVLNNDVSKSNNEIDTSLDSVNDFNGVDDVNTTFKVKQEFSVGDKVYVGLTGKIAQVTKIIDDNVVNIANKNNEVRALIPNICHATTENYERLQATFPRIEFEKPLTGSDLCFEKLRNGKKLVMCAVSDLSDEKAIKRLKDGDTCIRVIKDCDQTPYHFIDTHGIRHGFAVPLNDETGEPLIQAVLDE